MAVGGESIKLPPPLVKKVSAEEKVGCSPFVRVMEVPLAMRQRVEVGSGRVEIRGLSIAHGYHTSRDLEARFPDTTNEMSRW